MTQTGNYAIAINQFATYTNTFVWIGGGCGCGTVGAQPGPIDLTGYTAAMQFRPFVLSPTILYDASADITLGGVSGTISITISSADTATMTWFNGVYDLILTSAAGVSTRLLEGSVTVTPGVTP